MRPSTGPPYSHSSLSAWFFVPPNDTREKDHTALEFDDGRKMTEQIEIRAWHGSVHPGVEMATDGHWIMFDDPHVAYAVGKALMEAALTKL